MRMRFLYQCVVCGNTVEHGKRIRGRSVSTSQFRTRRWIGTRSEWPEESTILHRIETAELECQICGCGFAEFRGKCDAYIIG